MTLTTVFTNALKRIALAISVAGERDELARLDDAALHDLGISRAQARFEAGRSPWDVPLAGAVGPAAVRGGMPLGAAWN